MMKIGIDIRSIVAAGTGRGLVTYTVNLVKNLLAMDHENTYCLFIAKDQPIEGFLHQVSLHKNVKVVRLKRPTKNIFFWDQLLWYALLKKERIQLFHSLSYGIPLICPCRRILTIHDLTPLILPETIQKLRQKVVFRFNFFTAKYAERIITSSQNSKQDFIRYLHIPEEKISVIFAGVTEEYRKLPDTDMVKADIQARYQIGGEYILYVGGFDQHKNLSTLVEAFRLLLQRDDQAYDDLSLVLVGALMSPSLPLRNYIKTCGIEDRVIFTDFVPEEDLIKFYNAARLFVFPSHYEGFGLPPLEAMACGTSAITSHASSLPEVVGEAAIQVDPHSPEEFYHAIRAVLTDDRLRQDMEQKGSERAKIFSWKTTVRQTLQVYREVFRQPST